MQIPFSPGNQGPVTATEDGRQAAHVPVDHICPVKGLAALNARILQTPRQVT